MHKKQLGCLCGLRSENVASVADREVEHSAQRIEKRYASHFLLWKENTKSSCKFRRGMRMACLCDSLVETFCGNIVMCVVWLQVWVMVEWAGEKGVKGYENTVKKRERGK